jgi:hypothetical protein
MIRLGTLFWLILVSATGFAMFGVKYQVQALEDEAARASRATAAEEHELRVLEAEWAYLTRPETLEGMNRRYLLLGPIVTRQLHATAADIPLRPPPVLPPPELPAVVAAAEPAPAANAAASAPEGGPVSIPEPALSQAAVEPPAMQSALRAMPALLEKPAPAAQVAKGVTMKTAAQPSLPSGPPRRAKSLDDLIAQIMTSR